MKSQTMHYLSSILVLVSFQAQAMDKINRKALKPINKEIQNDIKWGLHRAAAKNQIKRVQLLLKGGAGINKQDKNGWTPLYKAVIEGDVEVTQQLLNVGADVNKQSNGGWTPLHWAARKGHVEVVQQLLKEGADVNMQNKYGWTPLYNAAYWGRVEVVQQLLKGGADVNKQNYVGETPLHDAVFKGRVEVAQQLIKGGAAGLRVLHELVAGKFYHCSADKRAKLIKLLVYNKPMLARLANTKGKTALQCAVDLDQHLKALLQSPEQYITKHPEEFAFIQDVEYNIQVAECNLLKRTTPNLVHKIRNRELGMPFYAKLTRKNRILKKNRS